MQPELINIKACARCGGDHAELEFAPFTLPLIIGPFARTHWALCPKTGEPIIVNVIGDKDKLRHITWRSDDFGDYWVADLMRNGQQVGRVGTYYEIGENYQRASKSQQELELSERFEIES